MAPAIPGGRERKCGCRSVAERESLVQTVVQELPTLSVKFREGTPVWPVPYLTRRGWAFWLQPSTMNPGGKRCLLKRKLVCC